MNERKVLLLELPEVARQLVLAVVAVERRVREEVALALEARERAVGRLLGEFGDVHAKRAAAGEALDQPAHLVAVAALVERDADAAVVVTPQVEPLVRRGGQDRLDRQPAGADGHRVEERPRHLVPQTLHPDRQRPRERVDAPGDAPQALGPVVDSEHARHHGQKHLGRADVARRLLAADVLLARLQREAIRGVAVGVLRHAHEPAGHFAGVLLAARHERRVRPAVAQRHAEPLAVADGDVSAPLARRRDERARE